jgi:predicted Zn-dependent protease
MLVALSGEELPGRHADAVRSFLEFIDNPDSPPLYDPSGPRTSQVFPSDIDRLNTLIASGKLDEALELLETFKDRSGSDQRSWIDAKIEEIRFIRDHNRFAETYNQAIAQYNGGAYAAAVKTLETLLAEQPDAEGADKARELLAEARSRL